LRKEKEQKYNENFKDSLNHILQNEELMRQLAQVPIE
jgi:hypothetical protein